MNCANCRGRLFLFGDSEELYPGSELVLCYACRKKISPFLEERNTYPTHAAHLAARRRELEATGVTPSGMAALTSYCAYLDRISPHRREVAEAPTQAVEEPRKPVLPTVRELNDQFLAEKNRADIMETRMLSLMGRIRLAIWVACAGGFAGVGSLIAILCVLLGAN